MKQPHDLFDSESSLFVRKPYMLLSTTVSAGQLKCQSMMYLQYKLYNTRRRNKTTNSDHISQFKAMKIDQVDQTEWIQLSCFYSVLCSLNRPFGKNTVT